MPKLGADWQASIGLEGVTPGAFVVSTGIVWEFQGPSEGELLGSYEILIDPSAAHLFFDVAHGAHSIPVPCMPSLEGVPVWTQGFRIENDHGTHVLVLLNALDLLVGV